MQKYNGMNNIMSHNTISAVHDDDLEYLLKSLGVYETVINGNHKCFFCGGTMDFDNILAVFPYNNNVELCCNNDECRINLLSLGKNEGENNAEVK